MFQVVSNAKKMVIGCFAVLAIVLGWHVYVSQRSNTELNSVNTLCSTESVAQRDVICSQLDVSQSEQ